MFLCHEWMYHQKKLFQIVDPGSSLCLLLMCGLCMVWDHGEIVLENHNSPALLRVFIPDQHSPWLVLTSAIMFQVHAFDSTFTRFDIRHCVSLFIRQTFNDNIYLISYSNFLNNHIFYLCNNSYLWWPEHIDTKMLIKEVTKSQDSQPPGRFQVSELFAKMSILLPGPFSLCSKFQEQYKH